MTRICRRCLLPEEIHLGHRLGFLGRLSLWFQGPAYFGWGSLSINGAIYGPGLMYRAAHLRGFKP